MSNFKETLKEILCEKNLSRREIAKISELKNARLIYNLNNYNPKIDTALKIVDFLDSSLDYFERKIDYFSCEYDKDYKINFFENLKQTMEEQKIKVKTLCSETGIGESTYYDWKNGKMPQYENLVLVANYLDCSIDGLLGRHYVIKK